MTEDTPIARGEARNAVESGVPAIPAGCAVVWTEDRDTGEPVRWHTVPMAPGSPLHIYGRLWALAEHIGGGRYTDRELLERGPVYDWDPGGHGGRDTPNPSSGEEHARRSLDGKAENACNADDQA